MWLDEHTNISVRVKDIRMKRFLIRGRGVVRIYRGDTRKYSGLYRFMIVSESASRSLRDNVLAVYYYSMDPKIDAYRSGYVPFSPGMIARHNTSAATIMHEYAHHVYYYGDYDVVSKADPYYRILRSNHRVRKKLARLLGPSGNFYVNYIIKNGASEFLAVITEHYYRKVMVGGNLTWKEELLDIFRRHMGRVARKIGRYPLNRIICYVFKQFGRTLFIVIGSEKFIERIRNILRLSLIHI